MTDNIFGDDANAPADVPVPEADFVDPAAAVPAAVDNVIPDPMIDEAPAFEPAVADGPALTPQQQEAGGADVPAPPAAPEDGGVVAPPLPPGVDGEQPAAGDEVELPPVAPGADEEPPAPPVGGGNDVPPGQGGGDNPDAPPVPGGAGGDGQNPFPVQGNQDPGDDVPGDDQPEDDVPVIEDPVELPVAEIGDSVGGIYHAITGQTVSDEDIADALTPEQVTQIQEAGGRIDPDIIASLLEHFKIPATVETSDIDQLSAQLTAGHGVAVSIDIGEALDGAEVEGADDEDANFIAMVTRIDHEGGLVWLNSSGDVDGDVFSVALSDFIAAWQDSGFSVIRSDQTSAEWHALNDPKDPTPVVKHPVEVATPTVTPADPATADAGAPHDHASADSAMAVDGTPAPTAEPSESADAPVLASLTQNPWIIIPGVIAVGGAAAAVIAARKLRRA